MSYQHHCLHLVQLFWRLLIFVIKEVIIVAPKPKGNNFFMDFSLFWHPGISKKGHPFETTYRATALPVRVPCRGPLVFAPALGQTANEQDQPDSDLRSGRPPTMIHRVA